MKHRTLQNYDQIMNFFNHAQNKCYLFLPVSAYFAQVTELRRIPHQFNMQPNNIEYLF